MCIHARACVPAHVHTGIPHAQKKFCADIGISPPRYGFTFELDRANFIEKLKYFKNTEIWLIPMSQHFAGHTYVCPACVTRAEIRSSKL